MSYHVKRHRKRGGWLVFDPDGNPIRFTYFESSAIDFANVLNALNALPLIKRQNPKS